MSEFSGPAAPCTDAGDPRRLGCAQVIAEVWTLLDGECTAETREKLQAASRGMPRCFRHYGLEERIKA